jgi:hypothetical protein
MNTLPTLSAPIARLVLRLRLFCATIRLSDLTRLEADAQSWPEQKSIAEHRRILCPRIKTLRQNLSLLQPSGHPTGTHSV